MMCTVHIFYERVKIQNKPSFKGGNRFLFISFFIRANQHDKTADPSTSRSACRGQTWRTEKMDASLFFYKSGASVPAAAAVFFF